jgi:hypothetical protein
MKLVGARALLKWSAAEDFNRAPSDTASATSLKVLRVCVLAALIKIALLSSSTGALADTASAPFARKLMVRARVLSSSSIETILTEDIEIKS